MIPNPPLLRLPRAAHAAVLMLCAWALAACSDRTAPSPAPTSAPAARVNNSEVGVQQVDAVLQQQRGLRPEQLDAAARQVLERLIDQQLALQKAAQLGLDRDPRVLQQVEAARREIVARAFVDKVGTEVAKPSAAEIQQYYDEHPALFKERRVYNLQELQIEARPEQVETLRAELKAARDIGAFVDYLKAKAYRFSANQAVRAAEQLPLQSLDAFARMKDGQAALVPAANGVQIIVVAGASSQPIGAEQAAPAIEQFLVNERRRKRVADEIKALRASASIEYLGRFAQGGAAGAAAAPASAALSGDEIGKGLGLSK